MANDNQASPREYHGVTLSSTFQDLEEHRNALIHTLTGHGLFPIALEYGAVQPGIDVIDSSLQAVRDGSAYVGIISHRYGPTPTCTRRNPNDLSITELQFNEAQRLGRPTLLFLMGENHPVRASDVEAAPERRQKLQAFRERAKQMGPESRFHGLYTTFDSLEGFREKAARAVAGLALYLRPQVPADQSNPHSASRPQKTPTVGSTPEDKPFGITAVVQHNRRSASNSVFISYSHVDRSWLERLQVHLKPLERFGTITRWDDTCIRPGTTWRDEVQTALDTARVAVLLVTADFLASDFIVNNELPPLLKAAEERGTLVLPVIVKPCRFEQTEEISRFQALNSPSEPLIALRANRREALFVKLSRTIEQALQPAS